MNACTGDARGVKWLHNSSTNGLRFSRESLRSTMRGAKHLNRLEDVVERRIEPYTFLGPRSIGAPGSLASLRS